MRITETHIYFWGSFMSQWDDKYSFVEDNITFYTAEQYMMYHKAKLFNDTESMRKLSVQISPNQCKQIGRLVKNFNNQIWDNHKYQIVLNGNLLKFQIPYYKKLLLETDKKILVEASPNDTIWGIGLHYSDNLVLDEKNWKGQNLLGKVLMRVRKKLKYG